MGIKIDVKQSGLVAKLKALAQEDKQGLYDTIGRTVATQVRLGFKLGVDPWGVPWKPLKFRNGQPLRDTGRLQRSITYFADDQGVTIGTNVFYAPVHQFGAIIKPKNKKRLAFRGPGGMIFAKKSVVPARAFLPIKTPGADPVLPPAWSDAVSKSIKTFLIKKLGEGA